MINEIKFDNIIFKETKYTGYFVSKCGKIISIKVKGGQGAVDMNNPRYHSIKIDKDGYCEVCLSVLVDGKHKRIYRRLHRLIYETWIGEIIDTIDHIDGVKTNNNISNLRCMSRKENSSKRPSLKKTFKIIKNGIEETIKFNSIAELNNYIGLSDCQVFKHRKNIFFSKKLNCMLEIIEV